jgi:hypothetical protein
MKRGESRWVNKGGEEEKKKQDRCVSFHVATQRSTTPLFRTQHILWTARGMKIQGKWITVGTGNHPRP